MENNFNIPKYRAKKIDSDEYVIGYLKITKYNNRTEYVINFSYDSSSIFGESEIDPTTLAINFHDMKDSENNPIFASLSKCGKGGDIADLDDGHREIVFIWHKYAMCIDTIVKREIKPYNKKFISLIPQLFIFRTKIIGIQK